MLPRGFKIYWDYLFYSTNTSLPNSFLFLFTLQNFINIAHDILELSLTGWWGFLNRMGGVYHAVWIRLMVRGDVHDVMPECSMHLCTIWNCVILTNFVNCDLSESHRSFIYRKIWISTHLCYVPQMQSSRQKCKRYAAKLSLGLTYKSKMCKQLLQLSQLV